MPSSSLEYTIKPLIRIGNKAHALQQNDNCKPIFNIQVINDFLTII